MHKPKQPLAEVFGFLTTDMSPQATRYRTNRRCPFNNKVPNCTKDKAKDPLGVCSVFHGDEPAITCPIRFREDWLITDDAAAFFFPEGTKWSSLTEVRLNDAHGKSAGNIDVVLVAYDDTGKILDFGALEIQAVYISGNVREPFGYYMQNPVEHATMDWSMQPNYPRPDYLSSSRKRLAPQLIYKGGILNAWRKKTVVALNSGFFATLPPLPAVEKSEADIAWLIYDLQSTEFEGRRRFKLVKTGQVYTKFEPALQSITTAVPGDVENFIRLLQHKLDQQMETAPVTRSLEGLF